MQQEKFKHSFNTNVNVRWSSGMSCMSGILISRYIYLLFRIPFVFYCFDPDKIVCIFGTASPIMIGFSAKQSSLIALQNVFKNINLIVPDIRLISLDRITNWDLPQYFGVMHTSLSGELQGCCEWSDVSTSHSWPKLTFGDWYACIFQNFVHIQLIVWSCHVFIIHLG